MPKVMVTEKAVRQFLRETMTGGMGFQSKGNLAASPVGISPVVDPLAAQTDPGNDNFKPQNRAELKVALTSMVDKISDDDASNFYTTIKDTIENEEEKDEKMKKQQQQTETVIRGAIRKMLREADDLPPVKKIPFGVHGAEYQRNLEKRKGDLRKSLSGMRDDEDTAVSVDEPAAGRERKNVMMTDVSGASFKDIAKEFGFAAESGAKAAVERAMKKAQFVANLDPDELEILTLTAMGEYIEFLRSSGELSAADVKLLKDHPQIVATLDGFREYLDKSLNKASKAV